MAPLDWGRVLDAYESLIERLEHQLDGETLTELDALELTAPPLPAPTPSELERYVELAQRAADVEAETREVLGAISGELDASRRKRSAALGYASHGARTEG